MKRLLASALVLASVLPMTASALEYSGSRRVTVVGTIEEIQISKDQLFTGVGGTFIIRSVTGQRVTAVLPEKSNEYEIVMQGRKTRSTTKPSDLVVGNGVTIRGQRVNTDTMVANLIVVTNNELNPTLTTSGILQSVGTDNITVALDNGQTKSYQVTNETEVIVSFTLRGMTGLSLLGQRVFLTMNPLNMNQVKVIRMTGKQETSPTLKPTTVELKKR